MNLENELNKITCRFVECEREHRIRQRGADKVVRTPLFVPSSPPMADGGGCVASPCPCAPPPDGGGREGEAKKAPALHHGLCPASRLAVKSGTPLPHHNSTSVRACQAPFWGPADMRPQTGQPGKGGLWPLVLTLAGPGLGVVLLFLPRGRRLIPGGRSPPQPPPGWRKARRPMPLAGRPTGGGRGGTGAAWTGRGTRAETAQGRPPRGGPGRRRTGPTTPTPGAEAGGEAGPPNARTRPRRSGGRRGRRRPAPTGGTARRQAKRPGAQRRDPSHPQRTPGPQPHRGPEGPTGGPGAQPGATDGPPGRPHARPVADRPGTRGGRMGPPYR